MIVSQLLLLFFFATTVALAVAMFLPVFKLQPWSNPELAIHLVKTQFMRVIDDEDVFVNLALRQAIHEGHADVAKTLVTEKGASATWKNDGAYMTALHIATDKTDLALLNALLPSVTNANARDGIGYPALHWAAYRPWLEGVKALVQAGASPDFPHSVSEATALHMAAASDFEVTKYLLENGASLNAKALDGTNALFRAVIRGRLEIAEYLLEKGADTTVVEDSGLNLFLAASLSGSAQMLDLVSKISPPVDPKARDNKGRSAFQFAFFSGNLEAASYLVEHGLIDLDVDPVKKITPVEFAVKNNYVSGLKFLIDNGADIKTNNAALLAIANENDFKEIAEMLATSGFAGIPL